MSRNGQGAGRVDGREEKELRFPRALGWPARVSRRRSRGERTSAPKMLTLIVAGDDEEIEFVLGSSDCSMAAQRWLPLESNPESMNRWASSLGLDTNRFSFQDVWGLDDDALGWVKPPVAVLLLFPITAAYEARRLVQDEEIAQNGVEGVADVLYFKQRIANACGTFGLLHALGNCGLPLAEGPLTILFEQAKGKVRLSST